MTLRANQVKLYPNQHMKAYLNMQCDYRRYIWNQGLSLWNDTYDAYTLNHQNSKPNARMARNELVRLKDDWEFQNSSRVLQLAIKDLDHSFQAFFNPKQKDAKHPKFKSRKHPKQGFKTDRAKIIGNKLRIDRPREFDKAKFYDIRMHGLKCNGKIKQVAITRINNDYYATLFIDEPEIKTSTYTNKITAVDLNVGHFNYTDGVVKVLTDKLNDLYHQTSYYAKQLAVKRNHNSKYKSSKNYQQTKAKLQRSYQRITRIQRNILHKFSHLLVTNYDQIIIEDLDVKQMLMTHVASKGMHRSFFGHFRGTLMYKCDWYGKHLILASPYYPSTQRCSRCGYIKKDDDKIGLAGNQKHHTKHNEYICYQCGFTCDRDENAVRNLLALV